MDVKVCCTMYGKEKGSRLTKRTRPARRHLSFDQAKMSVVKLEEVH